MSLLWKGKSEPKRMLDQALVGSAVTGVLALLAQAVAKCKCYVAVKKNGEGEYCEPQFACGFLDTNLGEMILSDKKDEASLDRPDAPAT